MSKLIAMIATAVMIDGVRTVIRPGEPLPDLNAHDSEELVKSGAAQDPSLERAAADQAAADKAAAAAEFEAARARVVAEQASTQVQQVQTPAPAEPPVAAPAESPVAAPAEPPAQPAAKAKK